MAKPASSTHFSSAEATVLAASLPVVAVVGRPNVGKSTLVNRLIGGRTTIVDDQPGVTRDRSYHLCQWRGQRFTVVDTGGLIPKTTEAEPFAELVNEQVGLAMQQAAVIVLLLDGKTGLTDEDELVVRQLRASEKPVLLAVNKIDSASELSAAYEFFSLGLGEPYPLSALHGDTGVGNLLDVIVSHLPKKDQAATLSAENKPIHLALVGRPNVGKSSILNALLGENRSIVSPVSGTTRDAIDTPFYYKERSFVLVDTAGIRRKTKVDYGLEMFSVDRSIRVIRRCDVAVLVIDAEEGLTDQDKRIAQKVIDAGQALVVAVNKWDTFPNKHSNSVRDHQQKLLEAMPSLSFAAMVYTSAHEGQRLTRILDLAVKAFENSQRRIATHVVNQLIQEAVTISPPPTIKNKRLRILYATQVRAQPPTFVLFVNDSALMKETYKRYLERKLRERIELEGSPVRFVLRNRKQTNTLSGASR